MKGFTRFSHFIFLIFLLASCGGDEADVTNAVDEANFLLTDRQCIPARQVLDQVGYQATNARYIAAYATTYACEASYSTVTFFGSDISKVASTGNGFFGSLATFTTSDDMTSPTDSDFVNLNSAINTILYAGNQTSSSSANRATVFSTSELNNLNAQALYMVLVNLGRWLYLYGNASTTGVKGSGTNPSSNTCLYTYPAGNLVAIDAINDGNTGSCTDAANVGSSYMMTGNATEEKARLCQGIVLFNNFIDLIVNVTFTSANSGELSNLGTTFNSLCQDVAQFSADLCALRDQSSCEAQSITDLEIFSAWLFENYFL